MQYASNESNCWRQRRWSQIALRATPTSRKDFKPRAIVRSARANSRCSRVVRDARYSWTEPWSYAGTGRRLARAPTACHTRSALIAPPSITASSTASRTAAGARGQAGRRWTDYEVGNPRHESRRHGLAKYTRKPTNGSRWPNGSRHPKLTQE